MSEFPPHIKALDDYGYAPPPEGHECGQCGISWSDYDEKLSQAQATIEELKERLEQYQSIAAKNIELKSALSKAREALELCQLTMSQFYKGKWLSIGPRIETALSEINQVLEGKK